MNHPGRTIAASLIIGLCSASLSTPLPAAQTPGALSAKATAAICAYYGGCAPRVSCDHADPKKVAAVETEIRREFANGGLAPGDLAYVSCVSGQPGLYSYGKPLSAGQSARVNSAEAKINRENAAREPGPIVLPLTKSQYYQSFEAFVATEASQHAECHLMIRQAHEINSIPRLRLPGMFTVLATESSLCLQAVRRETSDLLPTQIPRSLLVVACRRSQVALTGRSVLGAPMVLFPADNPKLIARYCAALRFKPGTHLFDP